jgi:hypothetical protein
MGEMKVKRVFANRDRVQRKVSEPRHGILEHDRKSVGGENWGPMLEDPR